MKKSRARFGRDEPDARTNAANLLLRRKSQRRPMPPGINGNYFEQTSGCEVSISVEE
jgi:hypothetical protein